MSDGAFCCLLSAELALCGCALLHADPPPEPTQVAAAQDIRNLIEQLGADRFRLREQASRELIAIGRTALPFIRQATTSRDAEVACRAQAIVLQIQASLPYLVDTLHDPDAKLRRDAAAGLERLGEDAREALPALVAALQDQDEDVREAAIGAVLAIDPLHRAIAAHVPLKAHVEGKYGKLLRRFKTPQDRQSFSDFRDYGYYQSCDWNGHTNIPAGYWVYAYPYWYVWKEQLNQGQ